MKILKSVLSFLGTIWRKLSGFNKQYIHPFIAVLTIIRESLDSDQVKWLVELTKTTIDDKIRAVLVVKLAQAIEFLSFTEAKKTPQETIDFFIKELKSHSPLVKDALIQKLAGIMVRSDLPKQFNGLKNSELDLVVQLAYVDYRAKFKKTTETASVSADAKKSITKK